MTYQEMAARNAQAGHHWFAPETMKFWETRFVTRPVRGYSHYFFVTADRDCFDKVAYRVRWFSPASGRVGSLTGATTIRKALRILSIVAALNPDDSYYCAYELDKLD